MDTNALYAPPPPVQQPANPLDLANEAATLGLRSAEAQRLQMENMAQAHIGAHLNQAIQLHQQNVAQGAADNGMEDIFQHLVANDPATAFMSQEAIANSLSRTQQALLNTKQHMDNAATAMNNSAGVYGYALANGQDVNFIKMGLGRLLGSGAIGQDEFNQEAEGLDDAASKGPAAFRQYVAAQAARTANGAALSKVLRGDIYNWDNGAAHLLTNINLTSPDAAPVVMGVFGNALTPAQRAAPVTVNTATGTAQMPLGQYAAQAGGPPPFDVPVNPGLTPNGPAVVGAQPFPNPLQPQTSAAPPAPAALPPFINGVPTLGAQAAAPGYRPYNADASAQALTADKTRVGEFTQRQAMLSDIYNAVRNPDFNQGTLTNLVNKWGGAVASLPGIDATSAGKGAQQTISQIQFVQALFGMMDGGGSAGRAVDPQAEVTLQESLNNPKDIAKFRTALMQTVATDYLINARNLDTVNSFSKIEQQPNGAPGVSPFDYLKWRSNYQTLHEIGTYLPKSFIPSKKNDPAGYAAIKQVYGASSPDKDAVWQQFGGQQ